MSGKAKSNEARYGRYTTSNRFSKNKIAKLKKHISLFPEDDVAKTALKGVTSTPTRAGYRGPKNGFKLSASDKHGQQIVRMMKKLAKVSEKAPKGIFILGPKHTMYTVVQLKEQLGIVVSEPKPKPKARVVSKPKAVKK